MPDPRQAQVWGRVGDPEQTVKTGHARQDFVLVLSRKRGDCNAGRGRGRRRVEAHIIGAAAGTEFQSHDIEMLEVVLQADFVTDEVASVNG